MLRVVGSFVAYDIPRPPDRLRGGELLQAGLEIASARSGHRFGDPLAQAPQHQAPGRVETGVEVHGRDDGLECVGEDRLLLAATRRVFTLAEQQVGAEVDLGRDLGKDARVHDTRAHLRELTLGQVGEVLEHVVRHHQPEHRIAEELEALVGRRRLVLRAPRAVRERGRAAASGR